MTSDHDFERALAAHVGFCYSVALELTSNPRRARRLAGETLRWAWQAHENQWDAADLKAALLSDLHERFLLRMRAPRQGVRDNNEGKGVKT